MSSADLIAELRSVGLQDFPPDVLVRIIFNFLADNLYEARLGNGARLCDVTDFHAWLRELACEANKRTGPRVGCLSSLTDARRTCHRCGHIHEGESECGVLMGGGRFCRCELEVPA